MRLTICVVLVMPGVNILFYFNQIPPNKMEIEVSRYFAPGQVTEDSQVSIEVKNPSAEKQKVELEKEQCQRCKSTQNEIYWLKDKKKKKEIRE